MVILGETDEGATVGEVAARVGVTLPATSRLLRRLERRELLSMATDEHDRRATRARLTERGKRLRRTIIEHRRGVLAVVAEGVEDPETPLLSGLVAIAADLSRYR